jgi:hypothetical protein
MNILQKTMGEMPNVFTSQEFNKRAISNGYSERILKKKGLGDFIKQFAKNEPRGKIWTKIEGTLFEKEATDANIRPTVFDQLTNDDFVEKMIMVLKSKGYKVMKPVDEWKEC